MMLKKQKKEIELSMEVSKDEMIKVAGIVQESIVDGPGIRFVVFVQGCNHKCEGCHNSHTQGFSGGEYMSVSSLIEQIKENPLLDGVTLSGGEPFEQADVVSTFAKNLKDLDYNIITYSGYTYEAIKRKGEDNSSWINLLENTDILIDGRFEMPKRNLRLNFRGSENQRIIDVKATMDNKEVTIIEL